MTVLTLKEANNRMLTSMSASLATVFHQMKTFELPGNLITRKMRQQNLNKMKTSKFSRTRLLGWSTASLFLGGMIRSSDLHAAHLWRMWVKTKFRSLNWTKTLELAEISSSSAVSLTSTLQQRSSGFQANPLQILIFLQHLEITCESGKLLLMENQST